MTSPIEAKANSIITNNTEKINNLLDVERSSDIIVSESENIMLEIGEQLTFNIPFSNSEYDSYSLSNQEIVNVALNIPDSFSTNLTLTLSGITEGISELTLLGNNGQVFTYSIVVNPLYYQNTSNIIEYNTISDLRKYATKNGLFGELTWETDNPYVLALNYEGVALGLHVGKANVTVSSTQNPLSSFTFEVEIIDTEENPDLNFIRPIIDNSGYVSCCFGGYHGHTGTDIAVPTGTQVIASERGKVIKVEHLTYSYGNYIVIEHKGGITTKYAHLSETTVEVGDEVDCGEIIGLSGSTGNSTGPHLHFEYIVDGVHQNAEDYINI